MGKLISEEIKYKGPRFTVVQKKYEREDGMIYIRDCVNPGDAVVILPITDDNEVIFIRQPREAIGKIALELPAGMIDENETPKETARRELEEEVGIKAEKIEYLTEYYASCGYTEEKKYIYLARGFSEGKMHLDDTEEILGTQKINIDECMKMLSNNEFDIDSIPIALSSYYFKYIKKG